MLPECHDTATSLATDSGSRAAWTYLAAARKHHTQASLARHLQVDIRTIRRWEARQSTPPPYLVPALQQLLPLQMPLAEGTFDFVDLFAGIGGMRIGFEAIGGRCVFSSEWNQFAVKTYAANFPGGHAVAGDITKIPSALIPDHDILLAGFPCQPFSIAGVSKKNALGRPHGFACEAQGTLFFELARILREKRPRAFLLENVKNLRSHDKGRTFGVIRRTLSEELGYHIHVKVINGAHFVPQHRERIYVVGFRQPVGFDWAALRLPEKGSRKLGEILHRTDGAEPELTWDDNRYFEHERRAVQAKYTLSDHLWRYLRDYAAKHRAKGNGFGFSLVGAQDTARTLSARYHKDGSEILIDRGRRNNPRRLTPRECARLMGFPDTFRIPVSDTQAYQLFAHASLPQVSSAISVLMEPFFASEISPRLGEVTAIDPATKEALTVTTGNWNREQLLVAFNLYCQLPFGKMHQRNPEIIKTAQLIGRSASALAMKLVNFASLDPAITSTGRRGLGNASAADRALWEEFHSDWGRLAVESGLVLQRLGVIKIDDGLPETETDTDFTGKTREARVQARLKQTFFRCAVLGSYEGNCCMTGISDRRLLVASHIVPWSKDPANRLNPRNGLCLSALHDKAFDRGLITVLPDMTIVVSRELQSMAGNPHVRRTLLELNGTTIRMADKFRPLPEYLRRHNEEVFIK